MLDQMFDTVRKATDATLQMQKEMFTRWTSFWPSLSPSPTNWAEEALEIPEEMDRCGRGIGAQAA